MPATSTLKRKQLLTEEEYRDAREKFGDGFKADMGAEAVRDAARRRWTWPTNPTSIREGINKTNSKQKIKDLTKRLKIIEPIRNSENKAEWMIYGRDPRDPAGSAPAGPAGVAATSPPAT